jgi:hypothetical protein
MNRTASVRLSRRFLNFTANQDLQLSAGLDLDWPKAAKAAVGGSSSSKLKAVSGDCVYCLFLAASGVVHDYASSIALYPQPPKAAKAFA